jgi:hypothetical protein
VKRALLSAVLTAALAAFLTGCSRNPVAPTTEAPAAGSSAVVQLPEPNPPIEGAPGATGAVTLQVGQSATLTAGRFSVYLHKNTLNYPITVTMWVASPTATSVEFTVSPSAANDFQVPAMVTADFSDMPSLDLSNQTMYYWDGVWEVPEGVSSDQGAHTITAPMKALSTCKVAQGPKGNLLAN